MSGRRSTRTRGAASGRPPRAPASGPPGLEPKLRLWVVCGDGIKFGHGRADFLALVHARGSIRAAAAEFGMSYRNAWGYLRELEQAAGVRLLVRHRGRGADAGTRLSPEGEAFLARYRAFRAAVDCAVEREFVRIYGGG